MTQFPQRRALVTVHAPAKVNLDLRILGKRGDGYHDLRTILQSVSLHDTLTVTRRAGPLTVRSRSRSLPRNEANLVWTAADVLWESLGHRGPPQGVAIAITKRIPMAGGLGGGSSDAAAALRGLGALWNVIPSPRRLRELAARIGSDVPFFLSGGLALGVGRGDRLRRLPDLDRHWIILAVPAFGVQTASAYQWFDRVAPAALPPLPRNWRGRWDLLRNDLEGPVVAHHRDIASMVDRLRKTGAVHAAMTGSGSTVYALYRRQADAMAARRKVRKAGWRTLLSRTVSHDQFEQLAAPRRRG